MSTLVNIGFEQCITDSCVFYKVGRNETVLLGVYVDDIIVTSTTTDVVDRFFVDMHVLELEDLGAISEFLLGMHLLHCNDGSVKIDQVQTIVEMLDKHGLSNLNGVRVTIGVIEPFDSEDQTLLPARCTTLPKKATIKEFQSLDGSLLWLTCRTRSDIEYAVHKITRRCHAPIIGD